jgi:hypothetical protein
MKPTWCTPTHQGLPNNTKSAARESWFGISQHAKINKTNKLPSFIDRLVLQNWKDLEIRSTK